MRRLAYALAESGVKVWLDEAELLAGDSLLETIGKAIEEMEYLAVVLSPSSTRSRWVAQELEMAMNRQLCESRVRVLPILYRDCEIPPCLRGKKYVDFREPGRFAQALEELLRRFRVRRAARSSLAVPISRGRAGERVPVLVANGLSVSIGSHQVLRNVNLAVNRGEILGVVGPSGSGKSVLCATLSAAYRAVGLAGRVEGRIEIRGEQSGTQDEAVLGRVCQLVSPFLVSQRSRRFRKTTLRRLLDGGRHVSDTEIRGSLEMAGAWEMFKDRLLDRCETFSPTGIMRLLVARALLKNPVVLIIDHVLEQFAPSFRHGFLQDLFSLNADGVAIVLTSLDFAVLAPWCDRVVVMCFGEITHTGTPAELIQAEIDPWQLGVDPVLLR